MMRLNTTSQKGITAVEVVIGVSIASLVLIFAATAIVQFMNAGRVVTQKTQALYLAEEGLELVRFVRDDAWTTISALTTGTTYYLDIDPGTIGVTSGTPEIIEGFTRSFVVTNVFRDGNDDIVTSGGSADTSAKYVTMTVEGGTPTTTASLTSIIADLDP